MSSSSSSSPTPPSSSRSSPISRSRAGSTTPPVQSQSQSRSPAQARHEHEHEHEHAGEQQQQRVDPGHHRDGMSLIDLVDFDSPPASPRAILARVSASALRGRDHGYGQHSSSHMADMRSLIDGGDSDEDDNEADHHGDGDASRKHDLDDDTSMIRELESELGSLHLHESDDEEIGSDSNNDGQPTPRASPELHAVQSIPTGPDTLRVDTPGPIITMTNTGGSSDDSKSSRSHLSANASPFNLVERPRTLSVARSGTPPSFFSDRNEAHDFAQGRGESSQISVPPHTASLYLPSYGATPRIVSAPNRMPSHQPVAFAVGLPSSVPMRQAQSLPAYPYPIGGIYDHTQTVSSGGIAIGSTLPPRESKAIKIVSPQISKMPPSIDRDNEALAKVEQRREDTPPEMTTGPVGSVTDADPAPSPDKTSLYQRRGKDEILSLYSAPLRVDSPTLTTTTSPASAARPRLEVPDPLLTPPLSEHEEGDGVDEMLGQIRVLGNLWTDQQGAQEKFAEGFKLLLDNLKQLATDHICLGPTASADKPALVEISAQLRALREENARLSQLAQSHKTALDEAKYESTEAFKETVRLKAENEVLKDSFGDVALQNSQLGTMVAHLKKRKDELKAVLAVTKGRASSRAQVAANSHPFVMILLDGHARMFDPDLLAAGRIGGQELAKRLIQAAQQATAVYLPDEDIPFLTGMLFVDVAKLVDGFVQFRDFCDGFNASSSLVSLVDTEGAEGTADKVREHLKFYCQMPNCKMILLGSDTAEEYIELVFALDKKAEGPSKIFVLRSTGDIDSDPYIELGKDRLVLAKGLFSIDPKAWNRQFSNVSRASTIAETSPPPQSRTRAITPTSTSTVRGAPTSPAEVTTSSYLDVRTAPVTSRRPSVSGRATAPRAPWEARRTSHAQPQLGPQAAQSEIQSVVDRSYNLSPITTPKAPTIRSYAGPHGSPTPRRTSHKKETIVIPIHAGEDDSIGGSPPESDEDEPSVLLPHSALKHVQRPTVIERNDPSRPEPPIQHGFRIRGAAAAAAAATATSIVTTRGPPSVISSVGTDAAVSEVRDTAPWKRKTPLPMNARIQQAMGRKPAVSGSNNIPLGGGQALPSSRPRPADFQYLRDLDPKPCHNHYLQGSCTDPECLFGHHYNLEISQWYALRINVKQLDV
ncbi:hypothetical protein IAU59_003642 [Kwoniella sp. CBS 9459]